MRAPVIDEAEIVVVGAGPAGAIAAFTLAAHGRDVLLIDKHSFPREKACGDCLTSSAEDFLAARGLADVTRGSYEIEGCRLIVDWRRSRGRRLNRHIRGCCITRRELDKALVDRAVAAGARFLHTRVTGIIQSEHRVRGMYVGGVHGPATVLASHVIAADGATSRMRRELFGPAQPEAPIGRAVRLYVKSALPLDPVLNIYAPVSDLHAGYGWMFPISEWVANVGVGYLTARGLPRERPITELLSSFVTSLRDYRGCGTDDLLPIGSATGSPVGIGFSAERCHIGNVLFVGDAARTCDPMTGEGIDQAMRSAHALALALHRSLRRGERLVGAGRLIARSNLRLGQDSATAARFARKLLLRHGELTSRCERSHELSAPFLSAARDMAVPDVHYPAMANTTAGELASEIGCGDLLQILDERIRDEVSTPFILAAELLHRELCAGVGPLPALTLFAGHADCGANAGADAVDQSVGAAAAVELLRAFGRTLARTTDARDGEDKLNNGLAVMIADFAVARAGTAAAQLGTRFGALLGRAIKASSEALALQARDRFNVQRSAEMYIEWASLEGGAVLSLAARMGALLANAGEPVIEALGRAGDQLGVALALCEDILALQREDPVTGRPPRRVLEEGEITLPVIYAIEAEPWLAERLAGEKELGEWEELVTAIRRGPGLDLATAICKQYAAQARALVVEALGEGSALAGVCDLPRLCLEPGSAKPRSSGDQPPASAKPPARALVNGESRPRSNR